MILERMKGSIMSSIKQRFALKSYLANQYGRYKLLVRNLDKKDLKVKILSYLGVVFVIKGLTKKFWSYLGIVFGILLLSWVTSFILSFLPAWNSNIDTINKLINVSPISILSVIFRFVVAVLFLILYWKAAVPFWNERPIERDRSLFARSGWGMAAYSFGAIILVICILMTCANIMKANTVFGPEDALRTDYPEDFGIIKRSWDVICQFADPGNIHSSTNLQGNVIALISAFAGILCLSGLAVSALVSMIARRTQQWKAGLIPYEYGFNNYVVIIGSNEQTATIIKSSLRTPGVEYVLVQTRKDVEKERAKIELRLELNEEKRVVFYYGDRALNEDVKSLHLEKAKEVYILGEDMHYENEEDHDAYNVSCLEHIARYMYENERINDNNKKLKCHVNFEYQSTFMAFKFTHLYRGLNETIEFLPFNVHEIWAKKILVDTYAVVPSGKNAEKKVFDYLPLDTIKVAVGDEKTEYIQFDSEETVHLVVVGMNQMGVALAMQAALLMHLPNFHRDNKLRTTITFIDNAAIKEGEFLRGRYDALFSLCQYREMIVGKEEFGRVEWKNPMKDGRYSFMSKNTDDQYENFMDIQWEFIEGNVASSDVRSYLASIAADERKSTTIAVCFNNPQQSIATALYLPEKVLKRALQVLVYQQNTMDMIEKVATSETEWKRYGKLRPFGMIEGCYSGVVFDNKLAKFANMAYAERDLTPDSTIPIKETFRHRTYRLWEELGIVDKLANIDLVDSFDLKLRSIGLNEYGDEEKLIQLAKGSDKKSDSFACVAKAEHLRWLTERLTMGYRPLDKDELDNEKRDGHNVYLHSKEYYKNKNRAHLDICSNEDLEVRDKQAVERDMDSRIVEMLYSLRLWSHAALLKDILSGTDLRSYKDIVNDMVPVGNIWMACHNVTIGQWEQVMGVCPKVLKNKSKDCPITNVSWYDVQHFLKVVRKETGLPFDIPDQEEWDNAKGNPQIKDMEGTVWQWTKTKGELYVSSQVFCGRSKKFKDNQWERDNSYWLPNFTSNDLGFRLVLRCNLSKNLLEQDTSIEDEIDIDDKSVIDNIIRKMVLIEGENPFRILPTPVIQRQWKAVMYKGKKPNERKNPAIHQGDYYPMENITFTEAKGFVDKLNDLYSGAGFRMPTNEEWKKAARLKCQTSTNIKFDNLSEQEQKMYRRSRTIWSNDIVKSTHEEPNYRLLEDDGTLVFDLLGNVWEWCDEKPKGDNSQDGFCRVIQGGSWRFTEKECRGKFVNKNTGEAEEDENGSYWLKDDYRADDLGFRIVISEENYQELLRLLDGNNQANNPTV